MERDLKKGCALLSLLLSGGMLQCQRARACYSPDSSDTIAPCIPYFKDGSELWEHVEANVGRDVVVDATDLVRSRWTRCTSKFCPAHEQSFELGDEACVPCNQCHLLMTLRGCDFGEMTDLDGHALECTADDCGKHIECPPVFVGGHRIFAHVERWGDGLYALSKVRHVRLGP